MLSNEKIEEEYLGQEQNVWFWKPSVLHTLLAENEFSWHPLTVTITLPSAPICC